MNYDGAELEKFGFKWVEADDLMEEFNFSDGFEPTQMKIKDEWKLYSDSGFNGRGRVVVRNKQVSQEFIIEGLGVSLDGGSLGEHMWIDSKSIETTTERRLQEANETNTTEEEPELNH